MPASDQELVQRLQSATRIASVPPMAASIPAKPFRRLPPRRCKSPSVRLASNFPTYSVTPTSRLRMVALVPNTALLEQKAARSWMDARSKRATKEC